MRCIEMLNAARQRVIDSGLTLTWDVLKLTYTSFVYDFIVININMRCIEMFYLLKVRIKEFRLTLTWDVLKYLCHENIIALW